MRKNYILSIVIFLATGLSIKAQQNVGINRDGSAPDASAMLDIKSTDKGLLIPRVSLTGTNDVTTIASPATSLLVYNNAPAGTGTTAVEPGYYYWNGTAWVKVLASENSLSSAWKMGGNTGTTPGTHFIGTTDNKPLIFKVNNQLSGHIDITKVNTFFGYQAGKNMTTGWGSIGIGQNALLNTTTGYDNIAIGEGTLAANISGINNMAIGKFAMTASTTGTENIAIGNSSLATNTTGSGNTAVGISTLNLSNGHSNTAIGRTALRSDTSGYENTALGRSALYYNLSGFQNTAVGRNALQNNTVGSLNTALGFNANPAGNNAINATAIGANAMTNCNNCVVLGSINGTNGATSDVNVGIGISNPSHPLSFKAALGGKLSLWNGGGANHYGIGVQSSLLQVYTDHVASDIAFGYGNSTAFTEAMRIKGNGNVGIGTSTPANPLEINTMSDLNKVQLKLHQNNNEFTRMRMTNNSGNNFWDFAAKTNASSALSFMTFYYSAIGTNVLTLRGDGNVGIGAAVNPTNVLEIQSNTDFNKAHIKLHESEIDFTRMRMSNTSGNYWDFAARPEVANTNAYLNFYYSGFGANILSLRGDGNATLSGILTQNSDIRFKRNLSIIDKPMDKISGLNGYNYYWKDDQKDKSLQTGLIAQEVQAVLPELVREDEKGMLSVNYSGLVPVLIEAVKEQQRQISVLQKENEELKKIKDEIAELKKLILQK